MLTHSDATTDPLTAAEATTSDDRGALRRGVYLVMIAVAAGSMVGRILSVDSVDHLALQQRLKSGGDNRNIMRPIFSANDRSRWCTIRALVEHGTYEIDKILFTEKSLAETDPTWFRPRTTPRGNLPVEADGRKWDTIDKVRHTNRDGELRFYSSKPPLLPTLLAPQYWVLNKVTGETLETRPYRIVRTMLIVTNVLPMIVMFLLLACLVERLGTSDWGKVFVMGAAVFGTLLNPFAMTLNNHIPAAVSITIAMYAAVRIWIDGDLRLRWFALAGLFAAFTTANELPALAFFAALTAALLWKAPRPTFAAYLPSAFVVAAGFFGTNLIAHDSWRPPYAHRTAPYDDWYDHDFEVDRGGRRVLVPSYWKGNKQGVDQGEDSHVTYALHVIAGHHGLLSLTPVWLLSLLGAFLWCRQGDRQYLQIAVFIGAITLVCLVFYLTRPLGDRNYGGVSSGFRWMFWFAPLWLSLMIPAADLMARTAVRRAFALVLLAASVLSASYPTWNPWTPPWIYQIGEYGQDGDDENRP